MLEVFLQTYFLWRVLIFSVWGIFFQWYFSEVFFRGIFSEIFSLSIFYFVSVRPCLLRQLHQRLLQSQKELWSRSRSSHNVSQSQSQPESPYKYISITTYNIKYKIYMIIICIIKSVSQSQSPPGSRYKNHNNNISNWSEFHFIKIIVALPHVHLNKRIEITSTHSTTVQHPPEMAFFWHQFETPLSIHHWGSSFQDWCRQGKSVENKSRRKIFEWLLNATLILL